MSLSRKISCLLITMAFLLTMVHSIVPHHHHGDIVCFGMTCQHEQDCDHDHHDCDCATCGCHHGHHPLHSEDNCVLNMPYILIHSHIDLSPEDNASSIFWAHLTDAILSDLSTSLSAPATGSLIFNCTDLPVLNLTDGCIVSHRGPPTVMA